MTASVDAAVPATLGEINASSNALSPFTLGPFPFSATSTTMH